MPMRPSSLPDHYEALGLSRDATPGQIHGAYRRLAKEYHPDLNPTGTDSMARINAAFEVLGDPERRREYDQLTGAVGYVPEGLQSGIDRARKAEDEAIVLAWRRTGGHLDESLFRTFYRQTVSAQRRKKTFFKAHDAFEAAWSAYAFAKGLGTLDRTSR